MSKQSQYFVLPGEKALLTTIELKDTRDMASHFLEHYILNSKAESWEDTCIPDIADLYSGSRACLQLMNELREQETPVEFKEKVRGDGLLLTSEQYVGLATLIETIRTLKQLLRTSHNISFEVH